MWLATPCDAMQASTVNEEELLAFHSFAVSSDPSQAGTKATCIYIKSHDNCRRITATGRNTIISARGN